MAILTGKEIIKPYIKKSAGYIKSLLSSKHVEMDDGNTLQTTINDINNNLTDLRDNDSTLSVIINDCIKQENLRNQLSTFANFFLETGKITFLNRCYINNSTDWGFTIRVGESSFGAFRGDTYYIAVNSSLKLGIGIQVNGATTATWKVFS